MARDLARELYRAFRNQSRRNRTSNPNNESQPREQIGDPQQIGSVLDELINSRDWRQGLAEGNIFSDWEKIVGSEIATHALPISLVDGFHRTTRPKLEERAPHNSGRQGTAGYLRLSQNLTLRQ